MGLVKSADRLEYRLSTPTIRVYADLGVGNNIEWCPGIQSHRNGGKWKRSLLRICAHLYFRPYSMGIHLAAMQSYSSE